MSPLLKNNEICLTIPGAREHLGLVRLVCAGFSHRLHWDSEIAEDIKLATMEACSYLFELTQGDNPLEILWNYQEESKKLMITVSRDSFLQDKDESLEEEEDWHEISLFLIYSLVDEVQVEKEPASITLIKDFTSQDD